MIPISNKFTTHTDLEVLEFANQVWLSAKKDDELKEVIEQTPGNLFGFCQMG